MLVVEAFKIRLDLVRVRVEARPVRPWLEGVRVGVGGDVACAAGVSVFPPSAADGGVPMCVRGRIRGWS